jgi:hypothetical protein
MEHMELSALLGVSLCKGEGGSKKIREAGIPDLLLIRDTGLFNRVMRIAFRTVRGCSKNDPEAATY